MNNNEFLGVVAEAFVAGMDNPRGGPKLSILHGAVAQDLAETSGQEVHALGYGGGKEKKISGSYYDKKVDITISPNGDELLEIGVGVKLVQNNYSQNRINYFENMLGETTNLRSNAFRYSQLFIVPWQVPFFTKAKAGPSQGEIVVKSMETFGPSAIATYVGLSNMRPDEQVCVPDLLMVAVVCLPDNPAAIPGARKEQYLNHYRELHSDGQFAVTFQHIELIEPVGDFFIHNDYEQFATGVVALLTP